MPKKILLVGSITDISPARHLMNSFINLGCDVFVVSDEEGNGVNLVRTGSFNIGDICKSQKIDPDFMVFIEGGNMNILPTNFDELNCPKYWWGIDTHNDYKKHLLISRLFDHSFIAQKDFVNKLQSDGIISCSWFPLAFPESLANNNKNSHEIDVAYVGSMNWDLYPERAKFLDIIKVNFNNIFIGTATSQDMIMVYSKSKIVFNYSPMNDLNMRFFEAMGSGALLLTNKIYNNGIDDIFQENEDFLTYTNSQDLIEKMNFLLKDSFELNRIAINGQAKVLTSHTYKARAEEILKFSSMDQKKKSIYDIDYAAASSAMGFFQDSTNFLSLNFKNDAKSMSNRVKYSLVKINIYFLRIMFKIIDFGVTLVKKI
jgi:hypothetical protein